MTGVGVTASGLRSAAESHAELLGDANIQSALSYAEGHSGKSNKRPSYTYLCCNPNPNFPPPDMTARTFYQNNGAEAMVKAWGDYVRGLIHQDCGEDEDEDMDLQILENIKKSNKQWRANVEKQLQLDEPKPPSKPTKRRMEWTEEEDCELRKRIKIHGEGSWKAIVESSGILQNRYQGIEGEPNIFCSAFSSEDLMYRL